MFKKYKPSQLLKYLGITRDTLRFYERKGLIRPLKSQLNSYRSYDILDIYRVMTIDYYKKRGLSIQQIHEVVEAKEETKGSILGDYLCIKKKELQKSIAQQQRILNNLIETENFLKDMNKEVGKFSIRKMPVYKVREEISDFIAVEEYENRLAIETEGPDIFSQMMRYIIFDKAGIRETKILIVEDLPYQLSKKNESMLKIIKHCKCLYTIVEEIQSDDIGEQIDMMYEMHHRSRELASSKGYILEGKAYAMIKHVVLAAHKIKAYIEIYIPIKN